MKKLYGIIIRGKEHTWDIHVEAEPSWVEDWRKDGLEVDEIVNTIPVWVVNAGLTIPWCFVQDLIFLKNPFK